jgi:phosphate transport system substrate-binding protein
MKRISEIFFYLICVFFLGCGNSESVSTPDDSPGRGTIHISADESFKPVIDSQVQVYEAKYPDVNLIVHYKPEAECIEDMYTDSIRMIISTRRYTKNEEDFMYDSLGVVASQMVIAYDAVAVIVHPSSPDHLFTMKEIGEILTGRFKKNLIPVFDGLKATSTVRFIVDSVLRGDTLTSGALAAKTSEEVVNYVARTPNAVGFIGVSWIGNKDDEQQQSFLTKVKLAEIESTDLPGKFIQPVQANIYAGRYPMIRELVYILKEGSRIGLGHGFANFMSGEKGQLIFRRAYLVPGQMQFNIRRAALREY